MRRAYEEENQQRIQLEHELEIKDSEIDHFRTNSDKKTFDMRNQIERVISEFTAIIDSKYNRIDNLLERKESELDNLRGLLKDKLKDFEKSITEFNDVSEDTSMVMRPSDSSNINNRSQNQPIHQEPDAEKQILKNILGGSDNNDTLDSQDAENDHPQNVSADKAKKIENINKISHEIHEIEVKIKNLENILKERKDLPKDRRSDL